MTKLSFQQHAQLSVSLLIFKTGQIHSRHKIKMGANYNWTKSCKNYEESFLWLNLVCKTKSHGIISHVAPFDVMASPKCLQKMTNQLTINTAMNQVKLNHPDYSSSHQTIRDYFVLCLIMDPTSCDFHQKHTLKGFFILSHQDAQNSFNRRGM